VSEELTFTFNRRTVEDQEIYVKASSLAEAWKKARADDAYDTCDSTIIKTTYRLLSPSLESPQP
jgi:hypothetical protein